jgi:hypothetical protein
MVGTLKDGWASMTTFGMTVADEEAGDVVFNEVQFQICEEIAEALVSATALA